MLIHKATMGVLDRYWTGKYRRRPDRVSVPVMAEFAMDDGFDPAEWWEIPRNGALGRKVRRCYPFCVPVTGADGSLVDVVTMPKQAKPQATAKGVRQSRQRRRKTGVLEQILKE